ncbi:MAG: hypothetical protein V4677_01215 [Bacteroidota bacterium]
MKKLVLLVFLFSTMLSTSCKKQYACQCSTTYEKQGSYNYTVSSVENIDSKTTKKTAKRICDHTEKQLDKNSADYKSGSETLTTSCAVK